MRGMKKYFALTIMACAIAGMFLFAPTPTLAASVCPDGQAWSDALQRCVTVACPDGEMFDDTQKKCVQVNEICDNSVGQFKSYIYGGCLSSYEDWLKEVWGWAMRIMIPLSVLILSAAGVIYMISEGDSKRIELAKKMIIGVLSGLGLLILGRLLLVLLLGETGADKWWQF